jgi:hypothetical protein
MNCDYCDDLAWAYFAGWGWVCYECAFSLYLV